MLKTEVIIIPKAGTKFSNWAKMRDVPTSEYGSYISDDDKRHSRRLMVNAILTKDQISHAFDLLHTSNDVRELFTYSIRS